MNWPGSVGGKWGSARTRRKCAGQVDGLKRTEQRNAPRVALGIEVGLWSEVVRKKRLPEGWLLSTSGSAPRLKSRLCLSWSCGNNRRSRVDYTDPRTRLSIKRLAGDGKY